MLGIAKCRRRAVRDTNFVHPGYERVLKKGQGLPSEAKAAYSKMAWWSDATITGTQARIFVLAPRGPDGDVTTHVDMWELMEYALEKMHGHVVEQNKPFAVVWVQQNDHRMWAFSAWYLRSLLHEKYGANLDAVHVVHPSWSVRWLRLALWPFANDEFWDRFHAHERIEFLDEFVNLDKLALPQDIYQYDKFLDERAKQMLDEMPQHLGRS